MDPSLAGVLLVDGLTHGAVYMQLAVASVLVFSVTRVIFVAQGDFVTFGALTLTSLLAGRVPGTLWLMVTLSLASVLLDAMAALRRQQPAARVVWVAARSLMLPLLLAAVTIWAISRGWPLWANTLLALAIVTSLGTYTYHLAFEALADTSVLTLMIAAIGVHFAMTGLGLAFFGAEGMRNPAYWEGNSTLGTLLVSNQALLAALVSGGLLTALWLFYDSGLLIGLKGFVAAVAGALLSYPVAAIAALGLGLIESFGSFYASAYKEAIVFTSILPVLLWLSIQHRRAGGEA